MRTIDADALKEVLNKAYFDYDGYDPNDLGRFVERVDEEIDNAPTIERPQGEWEEGTQGYFCSNCDEIDYAYYEHNFCPYCGADMRGDRK